jgi:Chalcone and stilbene synthases, N-terminal domain
MGVLVKLLPQLLPLLATQAAERALANAGNRADEIDALVISTCTGYLCPGLTSYVSERLGCRTDVLTLDLVGQGCVASLPNLCTSEALVAAGRCQRVLSICVEGMDKVGRCSVAFPFHIRSTSVTRPLHISLFRRSSLDGSLLVDIGNRAQHGRLVLGRQKRVIQEGYAVFVPRRFQLPLLA